MSYKKRGVLSVFEKSYEEKRKKSNNSISRTTLYVKCLFDTKINLRLKKRKENFWEKFQKYFEKRLSSPAKKMVVIIFPYMEIVRLAFF